MRPEASEELFGCGASLAGVRPSASCAPNSGIRPARPDKGSRRPCRDRCGRPARSEPGPTATRGIPNLTVPGALQRSVGVAGPFVRGQRRLPVAEPPGQMIPKMRKDFRAHFDPSWTHPRTWSFSRWTARFLSIGVDSGTAGLVQGIRQSAMDCLFSKTPAYRGGAIAVG